VLEAGERAPDFELPNQDGDPVKLSDLGGQTVVLYFYPRADTPGCTTQACGVRDHRADYAAAGACVIGISPDETADLEEFAAKHDLGFTLLADRDHSVAEAYGVWGEKSMYGRKYMGIIRSTFVIDAEGRIVRALPKVQPKKHDELVLKALAELAAQ
jgi:thioredoxin-dependent peroxiredoxin